MEQQAVTVKIVDEPPMTQFCHGLDMILKREEQRRLTLRL